jgi:hypothetical protein
MGRTGYETAQSLDQEPQARGLAQMMKGQQSVMISDGVTESDDEEKPSKTAVARKPRKKLSVSKTPSSDKS